MSTIATALHDFAAAHRVRVARADGGAIIAGASGQRRTEERQQ